MNFKITVHYPAHDPKPEELETAAAGGWRIQSTLLAPPPGPHAVSPLVIIWGRELDCYGGEDRIPDAGELRPAVP